MSAAPLGLVAGGGRLPFVLADAARAQGRRVHAVAHVGETDPALASHVEQLDWVRVGQLGKLVASLKAAGATQVVFAGSIGRVRSLTQARPDLGALRLAARLRSLRDDELLRAVASHFEANGLQVVAAQDVAPQVLAPAGLLAGPPLSDEERRDVALGAQVASALGAADVGQTVVVRGGVVLAVEAVEGTDEVIRRAGRLGGAGGVVVKRVKPGQDLRFDLPAIGPQTLDVMREAGARVLAISAGKAVLLDAAVVFKLAAQFRISVLAYEAGVELG